MSYPNHLIKRAAIKDIVLRDSEIKILYRVMISRKYCLRQLWAQTVPVVSDWVVYSVLRHDPQG
jgi:hypothetical protein